jgi:hypothetical protein
MFRALIIAPGMIPHALAWGGIQRVFYLSTSLKKAGNEVIVAYPRGPYNPIMDMEVTFERLSIPFRNKILQNIYEKWRNEKIIYSSASTKNKTRILVSMIIKKIDKKLNNEPSPGMGIAINIWMPIASKLLKELIITRRIDIVIISVPPFSFLKFIPRLKKMLPQVKIIADYRDPWNIGVNLKRILLKRETKYLEQADRVISFHDQFSKDILTYFPHKNQEWVKTIMNGYSEEDWRKADSMGPIERSNKFILAHIGDMSFQVKYRDPRNFISAFDEFKRGKEREVELLLVGASLPKFLPESRIKVIPKVPPIEALRYMLTADILILLSTSYSLGKYTLTGKFFDYIRSGRPILAIGTGTEAYKEIIEENCLGLFRINDLCAIKDGLDRCYNLWKSGVINSLTNNNYDKSLLSRENQNRNYVNIISSMI